jgi:hypothetical protein
VEPTPAILRNAAAALYPTEPLISYQINRQLSGWNLPPLVIRAFGAHCQQAIFHFGRLAQRAAGLVFRNLSSTAYHRQH